MALNRGQFQARVSITADPRAQSGLRIGGSLPGLAIGGIDLPVIRDPLTHYPYIPGSSLRGKLRSLLEHSSGLAIPSVLVYLSRRKGQEVRIHQSDRPDDEICLLFGRNPGRMDRGSGEGAESKSASPARLTVYDAPLDQDSITPQMRENLDDELTEVKSENAVDRITSQANPRTLERVPAGAKFSMRMILDVLCEEDKTLASSLGQALRLLEDDTLGGGGSRGSGRVKVTGLKMTWRGKGYYSAGEAEQVLVDGAGAAELQQAVTADDFGSKLS